MYNSRCTEIAAAVGLSSQVKVTQYLRGCPSEKKSYACCFKVNCNKLYINRKVMNCRIPKKSIHCIHRAFVKKLQAGKQETTDRHSTELIGYQMQPLLQNDYTVSISKHQSIKGCIIGYLFTIDTQSFGIK